MFEFELNTSKACNTYLKEWDLFASNIKLILKKSDVEMRANKFLFPRKLGTYSSFIRRLVEYQYTRARPRWLVALTSQIVEDLCDFGHEPD